MVLPSNGVTLTQPVDLLILSNGPGEITTWVRPVVQALRQQFQGSGDRLRISVMLSPCPHAMGKEAEVARIYPEVDRVQSSEYFWDFLLWGKTAEGWDWSPTGVVLFLGGDQFFPLVIGKRLGYRTVIYAEWEARWSPWVDAFAVMNERVRQSLPRRWREKATVVGDLMVDVGQATESHPQRMPPLIGLLPGSKPHKLNQGVPFTLAIATEVWKRHPDCQFELFLAPTVTLTQLAQYASPTHNPMVAKMGDVSAQIITPDQGELYLLTSTGLTITICRQFPALTALRNLSAALTTVGANTAQLGALAVPMIVLLPTQHLDAMRNWDGVPGLLARLPLVGQQFARLINHLIVSQNRLFAWPNLWADREIVPELVGHLTPLGVAEKLMLWLDHPDQLEDVRQQLEQVRGKPGAAIAVCEVIA
ncbi:MAG: lipid-A-disaccharide synthase, partial [Synechocystis sp.]|nr:lipid-A-disaccharide synthase [Synechocystis sp.]